LILKTPFARVRGLGAARAGTEHFWRQRVTAIVGIPLTIAFVAIVVSLAGASQASVLATLSNPLVAMIMIATVITLLVHMRIGMRDIIDDYVHTELRKIVLLIANTCFTLAIGLAALYAILKINFGL
jgi:succinate dehydrogenase / fumarate reductase membrane anchor subunit